MGAKSIVFLIFFLLAVIAFSLRYSGRPKTTTLLIGETQIQVERASDLVKQIQGLSGRESLCPDCGMLFVFDKSEQRVFWMKDMRFPLDIIFIKDKQVTEIFPAVSAPIPGQSIPRVQSSLEADMVLEVNAGFVEKHKIHLGQIVKYF